ncbi:MAG: sigma-E processing peptidase SpoIIGA [Clostridia bacterium]|nr:sigma-E processing peptidase SpoIIGA [Clostridia bacterium]
MTAYLDLIILENFCMNYLIIYTTGKILNRKTKKTRLCIASLIGVLYIFSLYFNVKTWIMNTSKFIVSLVIVQIAFKTKSLKNVLKEQAIFLFITFVYAGCALGFVQAFKPRVIYMVNGIIIGGEYIFEIVGISAVVSFLLIKISVKIVKICQRFSKKDMICHMKVYNQEKVVSMDALIDTGNLLVDSTTGSPVIIVDYIKVLDLFSKRTQSLIETMMGGDELDCSNGFDTKLRIIPYSSVGEENGIMVVYKITKIKVEYHGEVNELNDVLIGFYNGALSKNNKYSALIGLQVLERSNVKVEYNTNSKNKGKYSIC